jgi:Arc/MetJ family transcription regulator
MRYSMHLYHRSLHMRTTVSLDDEVMREARELSGITENAALIREALQALIQRESARQLIQLGGTAPTMEDIPRRQSDTP